MSDAERRVEDGDTECDAVIAARHLRVCVRIGDERVTLRLAAGACCRWNADRWKERALGLAEAAIVAHVAAAGEYEVDAFRAVERTASSECDEGVDVLGGRDAAARGHHPAIGIGVEIVECADMDALGLEQRLRAGHIPGGDHAAVGNKQGAGEPKLGGESAELVEGAIIMMTNPTETHEQIAGNIGAPLKLAMDARGCRTYQGGMRVQRSDDPKDTDKTRPDIVVRCGPAGSGTYVTDPLIVVEVLSPSTIDIDRGPKLDFYKSLPTVRHIALVYQDQMRVEHYRRAESGFELEVLKAPGDALSFEAVDFRVELNRVYFGVIV